MTKIAELIPIPEHVHQGDFVLKLTEGVSHAEETLRSYVVTPQLEQCFDQALKLIQSAVEADRSKGAYLHGSFGSGKSHFMAVLSLLLQGDPAARSKPELADVVAKHNSWTEDTNVLVVPYHLIGAVSLESAVLGQYAAFVRERHPDAPTPGFYRAEKLFDDARRLREQMGDDVFFDRLGSASQSDGSGWGALDTTWDAQSFEEALDASPGSEERARLVGDLVDTFFGAHRDLAEGREEGFVPLDEGLVVLSRHARDLGYDAVVLFLDELILWLASHAADQAWINREGQKVAKLVEATKMDRALPIVSFIARQRDLRELVGEHLPGAEQLGFADVLDWWQARFDTITLEDRNLPAIVSKRLLRPKDSKAARHLEAAFEDTTRVRNDVLDTLLTQEGDREMFRKVYPFSPALVQTLIAVSSLLQRERTALKLLLQLLVDQRETLEVGDIVPVGDLYDVIESGDEPFSQAMKQRFDQARQLYRTKLVPMLEEQYSVSSEDVAAGRAPEDKANAFRNDARLMKTLVLSALAEGVEALKGLTPARLAALNHGTVRSPIPGQESQIVLRKVQNWAAQIGEIKVADDARNPVISLHLVGVETEGILENAKANDNYGNRIRKVRRLLFNMVGVEPDESLLTPKYPLLWRGTQRECEILFQNVHEWPLDNFEPLDASWRVIIDYPFDQTGKYPSDDIAKIQAFRVQDRSAHTLVWLPAFLTPRAQDELGRLVVLDYVLSGNRLDEYGSHLSQADRELARVILVNQRDQVRQRIKNALLTAYGISNVSIDAIDADNNPEKFHSLLPGLQLRPPVGATIQDALENLLDQAFRHQYPAHPEFEGEVKIHALRRVHDVVQRAAEAPGHRVEVDRSSRDDVRRIAVPLGLGQMGEAHFVLQDDWARAFDKQRAQDSVNEITVRRLREWIDQPKPRGLPSDIEDLIILTYALQTNRSFYLHGGHIEPTLGKLQNELELREQSLPDETTWEAAAARAAAILGVTVSPFRSAGNVAKLSEEAKEVAARHLDALRRYVDLLEGRLHHLGADPAAAPRMQTARATYALASSVSSAKEGAVAASLARAEVATSKAAMGTALKKSAALAETLERADWELLDTAADLTGSIGEKASKLMDRVREALRHDEHVTALQPVLADAKRDALAMLKQAAIARTPVPPASGDGENASDAVEPLTPTPEPPTHSDDAEQRGGKLRVQGKEVDKVLSQVREEAQRSPDAWIEVEWRVERQ